MAHLSQAASNWGPLFSMTPALWQVIDTNTFVALNGDNGGFWTPTNPIVIGGAGMWFCGLTQWAGASTVTTDGNTRRITFGDSDYFTFPLNHPGVYRIMATACAGSKGTFGWTVNTFGFAQAAIAGAIGYVELNLHDGATLQGVFLSYIVQATHGGGMPATVLRARVVKIDMLGNVTVLSKGDLSGFVVPSATTPAAYYNGGGVQLLSMQMSGAVRVDKSNFRYVCQIVDESGANAQPGNVYQDVQCVLTAIGDTRPQ